MRRLCLSLVSLMIIASTGAADADGADHGPKVGRICTQGDLVGRVFQRVQYVQSLYPPAPVEGQDQSFYYIAFAPTAYVIKGFTEKPADPKAELKSLLESAAAMPYVLQPTGLLVLDVNPASYFHDPSTKHHFFCRIVASDSGPRKAGDVLIERHVHMHIALPNASPDGGVDIISQFYRPLP